MLAAACTPSAAPGTPHPAGDPANGRSASETVTVRDPQLEQRIARLELRLLERDPQLEELQARLDEARRGGGRAAAKPPRLPAPAARPQASAEAGIALQSRQSAPRP